MEQSFNDLVPDDWLDHASKRPLDESENSSLPCLKRHRLSLSSSPHNTLVSSEVFSATAPSSDLENSCETTEDASVNEPDFNSDQDFILQSNNNGRWNGHTDGKYSRSHQKFITKNNDSDVPKHNNSSKNVSAECSGIIRNDASNGFDSKFLSNAPKHKKKASSSQTVFHQINDAEDITSINRDAKIIAGIVPNKDISEICALLLEHKDNSNRLDIVTYQLTSAEETVSTNDDSCGGVNIFDEVKQVAQAVPSANVNEIYSLLEQLPPSTSRAQSVIANLISSSRDNTEAVPEIASVAVDSTLIPEHNSFNDPLFHDMRTIAKMFPEKDRNEIYALLEANFNKENRLENVINEILHGEVVESEVTQQNYAESSETNVKEATSLHAGAGEDDLEGDVERMKSIFPDCDPNYLYEKLDSLKDKVDRTTVLAAEMFEKKDYPKLKDLLDKEREKERSRKIRHLEMNPQEFLKKFSEPVKTFSDCTKELSDIYKQHADICIKNEFPLLKAGYLDKVLVKHNKHLYPAYKEISTLLVKTPIEKRSKMTMFVKKKRPGKLPMPEAVDEYFYHELWFVYNELSVLDYVKQKEQERKKKIENARKSGELHECSCCYDDECLLEDLVSCPDGHLFCKTCIVRSTEAAFGEMKTKFPCLTGDCDKEIPLSYLQTIIPASLFSKIVRRLQEEEVLQANIPDLVICPFCPFAAIMSNPDDKVFKCLNPDCLKESCRLCREPNHVPLRCNEVEKKAATDMRVFIENRISEAVMRKCHKCGKHFVKEDGCNKMTCVCGATSCYACKAVNINYDHFENNKKCANTDPNTIHQRDMEEAAVKAKNEYLLKHPEAADVELKADVKDMIKDYKNFSKGRKRRHLYADYHDFDNYDSDDESDDEEEESEDESDYEEPEMDEFDFDFSETDYDFDEADEFINEEDEFDDKESVEDEFGFD